MTLDPNLHFFERLDVSAGPKAKRRVFPVTWLSIEGRPIQGYP